MIAEVTMPVLELEGTWEEILKHAPELQGRKVRLLVLADDEASVTEPGRLPGSSQEMLNLLDEWDRIPLSEEEAATLDELEVHLREQPFTLREVAESE